MNHSKNNLLLFFITLYLLTVHFTILTCSQNNIFFENTENRLRYYVNILASDSMKGREAGTEGADKSAKWINNIFKNINIQNCDSCLFTQKLKVVTAKGDTSYSENIIGYLMGNSDSWILICAHYDHIGYGGKYSRNPFKNQIHKGADDNASGVAVLIEIADRLSNIKTKNYNYIFIALTGHETGLYGSTYFAQNPTVNLQKIKFILNLDMLGRLDNENPNILYYISGKSIFSVIENKYTNEFNFIKLKYLLGDHSIFESDNIPVVALSTGVHEDYHTVNDIPELINYKGMIKITDFLYEILLENEK